MADDLEQLITQMPFAAHLGITLEEASGERVVATLPMARYLCTSTGVLHGGVLMSLADTVGALRHPAPAPAPAPAQNSRISGATATVARRCCCPAAVRDNDGSLMLFPQHQSSFVAVRGSGPAASTSQRCGSRRRYGAFVRTSGCPRRRSRPTSSRSGGS